MIKNEEIEVPDFTYENDKYILEIYQDMDAMNPRESDAHLGKMITWHRNYNFTDRDVEQITPEEFKEKTKKNYLVLPLFAYEHSSISLSLRNDVYPFTDGWDSYQIGFIFASYDDIRKWFEVKDITSKILSKAKDEFEEEVEDFNDYLNGNVYRYLLIEKSNNNPIDECSGFKYKDIPDNIIKFIKENIGINLKNMEKKEEN